MHEILIYSFQLKYSNETEWLAKLKESNWDCYYVKVAITLGVVSNKKPEKIESITIRISLA